ncbi:aldehyde dehydrogenase family protein [Nocardia takedensis]
MTVLELPAVVTGRRYNRGPKAELRFPTGAVVSVPELDATTAARLRDVDRTILRDVPLDEITAFLHRVGRNWRSREYAHRRLYVRRLVQIAGLSETMAETEADWIALYLSGSAQLADQVAAELGDRAVIDGWVRREDCEVRAMPVGLVGHAVAGNVPLAAVSSVVRAVLTKNVSVVKHAARDPFTPISLALSFLDVDAEHPMARAVSTIYWSHDNTHGAGLLADCDAVCAWGGQEAIEAVAAAVPPGGTFLPFGPKRSLTLVGREADPVEAAYSTAHDVSRYDQQACFSTQRIFVERPVAGEFLAALGRALEDFRDLLPPGAPDRDLPQRRALSLLEEQALGNTVTESDERDWAVVTGSVEQVPEHPLYRTVFVTEVDDLGEAVRTIGPDTQTVGVYPPARIAALRDELAARGVHRVVQAGLANFFRLGGAHDGMYPMQRLVRYVVSEAPAAVFGKGALRSLDQTALLRSGGRVTDLLP